jgi:hypothetical protein
VNDSSVKNHYENEAEGWQDLLEGGYDNKESWTWTFYDDYECYAPHQGWKIHVSAHPGEGREVAEAVLPHLQENSISHKITDNPQTLESYVGGNEHRLITIFPSYDSDKRGEITLGEEVPFQCFEPDSRNHNIEAINANTVKTGEIIRDVLDRLEEQGLLYEPTIDGEEREENQVGDTRVHYRYAINQSDALIRLGGQEPVIGENLLRDGELDVVRGKKMIGPEGDVISDQRHPETPEVAEHPIDLNWIEEVLYSEEANQ